VLLDGKLLKFSVKLLGNAQIHSHTPWNQSGTATSGTAVRLEQEDIQWGYALQRIQAANFAT
jgi:lipoprotein-anchoring transpeptidase ErfK/SrfK